MLDARAGRLRPSKSSRESARNVPDVGQIRRKMVSSQYQYDSSFVLSGLPAGVIETLVSNVMNIRDRMSIGVLIIS